MSTRTAQIAGKFYPAESNEIQELIREMILREKDRIDYSLAEKNIKGAVLPHAGHVYSGYQTIHFFEILSASKNQFDTFVLLHPIHRGGFPDYASDHNRKWETPLGQTALDMEFINYAELPLSETIHQHEHSAEVLLPFLQYYFKNSFQIVPVGICRQHPDVSKEIAEKINKAQNKSEKKICVIASSDFSHFVDPDIGYIRDQKILDAIFEFNPQTVFERVRKHNITVCGYGPIMSLMYYHSLRSVNPSLKILARGHSGEVYPSQQVVDYVSILFYDENL